MTKFLLALALAAAECTTQPSPPSPAPVPSPSPAPTLPAPSSIPDCASACAQLAALGCPDAAPTAAGASCVDVCKGIQTSGTIPYPAACVTRASNCDAAEACFQ